MAIALLLTFTITGMLNTLVPYVTLILSVYAPAASPVCACTVSVAFSPAAIVETASAKVNALPFSIAIVVSASAFP